MVEVAIGDNGRLVARSQIEDYMRRGKELESMSFMSFIVDTTEVRVGTDKTDKTEVEDAEKPARGRPRNLRSRYLPTHPKTATLQRQVRMVGHRALPNFIGRWFPKKEKDDSKNEYYFCCMLALLKSWRSLEDLKGQCESWKESFTNFMAGQPKATHDIVSNIQFYYQCGDAAERDRQQDSFGDPGIEGAYGGKRTKRKEDAALDDEMAARWLNDAQNKSAQAQREERHGADAVQIGKICGVFGVEEQSWQTEHAGVKVADAEDIERLVRWQKDMAEADEREGRLRVSNEGKRKNVQESVIGLTASILKVGLPQQTCEATKAQMQEALLQLLNKRTHSMRAEDDRISRAYSQRSVEHTRSSNGILTRL